MARKQSGGFNKFLNFIGLVDDAQPRDSYADEYDSGNYGRPSTYVPRQRATREETRRTAARSLPAQGGRSNYGTRTYGSDEDPRANRRAPYADDYASGYGASTSSRTSSRPRSRFEEAEEPAYSEPVEAPVRAARSSAPQRTVMFSLTNLRDANRVITALVKSNTIVMTIDTDDEHLRERIVDTLSGAVFALDATIRKASDQTYLLAPKTVNVKSAYDVDDRF